jgi:hypothetical protein
VGPLNDAVPLSAVLAVVAMPWAAATSSASSDQWPTRQYFQIGARVARAIS